MVKWVQLLISEELLPVRWRLGEKVVREEGRLVGLWMEELWLPSRLCRRERNVLRVDGSVRQGEVESASTESKLVVDRYEDNSLEGDTVEQLLQAGPPCTPRACPPAETSAGSLTTFSPSLHLTGSNSSDINN